MIRVGCYIDGFNIYHALDDLARLSDPFENHIKWLNLAALCEVYTDPNAHQIECIKYFTAYQNWRPDRVTRHKDYIAALRHQGVQTILGQFKEKQKYCNLCEGTFKGHEEKESDVNLATHLVADAHDDKFDAAFIFSRDSDLAGPMRHIRQRFPAKRIKIIAPQWRRHSKELSAIATHKAFIREDHVRKCRLPEEILSDSGRVVARCPADYGLPD